MGEGRRRGYLVGLVLLVLVGLERVVCVLCVRLALCTGNGHEMDGKDTLVRATGNGFS
jgi:hypothetical protein